MKDKIIKCKKCGKVQKDTGLFHYKNGYPCLVCKSCIIKEIKEDNSNIIKWMKEFNIPFIQSIWNRIQNEAMKSTLPCGYIPPFGRYLATMKLPGYINFNYGDLEEEDYE